MNKFITLITITLITLIASCGQPITHEEELRLKNSITALTKLNAEAISNTNKAESYLSRRYQESLQLDQSIDEKKKVLNILEKGRRPIHILKLRFQEHKMELSFDRISFEFEVPVDEKFYHDVKVGEKLANGSRSFSLFHGGDIKVVSKRIQ